MKAVPAKLTPQQASDILRCTQTQYITYAHSDDTEAKCVAIPAEDLSGILGMPGKNAEELFAHLGPTLAYNHFNSTVNLYKTPLERLNRELTHRHGNGDWGFSI